MSQEPIREIVYLSTRTVETLDYEKQIKEAGEAGYLVYEIQSTGAITIFNYTDEVLELISQLKDQEEYYFEQDQKDCWFPDYE